MADFFDPLSNWFYVLMALSLGIPLLGTVALSVWLTRAPSTSSWRKRCVVVAGLLIILMPMYCVVLEQVGLRGTLAFEVRHNQSRGPETVLRNATGPVWHKVFITWPEKSPDGRTNGKTSQSLTANTSETAIRGMAGGVVFALLAIVTSLGLRRRSGTPARGSPDEN